MGKGVVCHFFSNCLFATSRCIEKEAVDKMIAHFVTAPFRWLSQFYVFIHSDDLRIRHSIAHAPPITRKQ